MIEVLQLEQNKEAHGCPMVVFRIIRHMDQIFPTKYYYPKWTSRGVLKHAVDGENPAPVDVGPLSHYFQGLIQPSQVAGLGISEPSTAWKTSFKAFLKKLDFFYQKKYTLED